MYKTIWIIGLIFISSCTNWPPQGYYYDERNVERDYANLQLRFDYLNLHYSIALQRGASQCVPALSKRVADNQSRVLKSIYYEELRHSTTELGLYEESILDLIINLNQLSTRTRCASSSLRTGGNPVVYQLDLLMKCEPRFLDDSALLTSVNQACLKQAGLLLAELNDINITLYRYNKPILEAAIEKPDVSLNLNTAITLHDMALQSRQQHGEFHANENSNKSALVKDNDIVQTSVLLSSRQLEIESESVPDQIVVQNVDDSLKIAKSVYSEANQDELTRRKSFISLYNNRVKETYQLLSEIAGSKKVFIESLDIEVKGYDVTELTNSFKLHKPYYIQSKSYVKQWRFLKHSEGNDAHFILPTGFRL